LAEIYTLYELDKHIAMINVKLTRFISKYSKKIPQYEHNSRTKQ